MDTASCPVVSGTPKVLLAAFTKETDFFAERNIEYLDPAVTCPSHCDSRSRCSSALGERLGITEDESDFAVSIRAGRRSPSSTDRWSARGKQILEQVEEDDRMCIALLMLGRPYHNDPGLNHGVLEEFQALGYPILHAFDPQGQRVA